MTALEEKFYDFELGKDYPKPIVDVATANRSAIEKMWQHRDHPEVLADNARILNRHTFRKTRKDKPIINFQENNIVEDDGEGLFN